MKFCCVVMGENTIHNFKKPFNKCKLIKHNLNNYMSRELGEKKY